MLFYQFVSVVNTAACSVGIPILEKELLTVAIPDISGDADTPIGSISYSLSKSAIQ